MTTQHTKGVVFVKKQEPYLYVRLYNSLEKAICRVYPRNYYNGKIELEDKANANLITEAFNVANETGKTPRRLAEENKLMLEALEFYKKEFENLITKVPLGINNKESLQMYFVIVNKKVQKAIDKATN